MNRQKTALPTCSLCKTAGNCQPILALLLTVSVLVAAEQPNASEPVSKQLEQGLQDTDPQKRLEAIAKSVEKPSI